MLRGKDFFQNAVALDVTASLSRARLKKNRPFVGFRTFRCPFLSARFPSTAAIALNKIVVYLKHRYGSVIWPHTILWVYGFGFPKVFGHEDPNWGWI